MQARALRKNSFASRGLFGGRLFCGAPQTKMNDTDGITANVESTARHEAAHLVIAALQSLRLRPEGLAVDASGFGLACYYSATDGDEASLERNVVATLAGFAAEERFREERSYPARDFLDVTFNSDIRIARELLAKLAGEYFANESRLANRLEQLIDRHWLAIEALATALLAKPWEPLRPLKSGGRWAHENENIAKYLSGVEVVSILSEHRILAVCDWAEY